MFPKRHSSSGPIPRRTLFTQNVRMGLDGRKHRRNLNTVAIGGSGAGKSHNLAKPNIMQANTSFVVLDPKGELVRDTGHLLEQKGYEVRVLDLLNMEKSFCYNPFAYLRDDKDVQRLVTNLFKSTTPKGSQSQDPFWDTSASMLLLALIFYLHYEAPEDEQNFPMVMEMLRAGEVREDDDCYQTPLDELFERLEMKNPDHIAVKYYKDYHSGSAKTLKSIQITLAARLEKFNLSSLAALTATDELDRPSLGEKKVALFALIPDNDTSFNFLVSILYTQIFQQLFWLADHKYGGSLPVPVHFLMDEFANVSLPDDFDKILATMRSRNVSVTIILQNIAQLKALFEKQWESILGNCDEMFYLGGNETSTHKLISESYLGKATIDTNTYGKSTGRSGNYSTNYQITGRDNISYDVLEMSGSRAVWPEVLSVYAVKTTTDSDNAMDVATVDDSRKAILKDIFWQMNEISSRTEINTEPVIEETDDGHGNIVETSTTVTRTTLYITVSHKTAEEMAEQFGFTSDQRAQLAELLADENNSLWAAVLYGIGVNDDAIVVVALSQVGNIGVQWFKDRGQWADNSIEPTPGMIIFFDWDNSSGSSGPQDGQADHVGIVEKCENGIVYTVEGNSGDSCRQRQYPVGYYQILGYGIPAY
ncbi:MAG: type IV secretory system conjugative DNA transfer family protein [Fusicatenibacter sp.]|nr:type IV secretory system conjugative DNA transfer family protein [Fusicatenibacter sp.]